MFCNCDISHLTQILQNTLCINGDTTDYKELSDQKGDYSHARAYTKLMKHLLSRIREVGTSTLYCKGSSLFFQGEVPRYAIIILDGVVKAYTISREGDETIVHLYGKNSIIPIAWVSHQSPSALFNYEAVNDVRCIKVKRDELEKMVDEDPVCTRDFLDYIVHNHASMLLRITGLAQSRAIEKICYTLYFLLFRYGIERGDNTFVIDLRLTQGMLAELIGQTRESTAKNLKVLKDAGVVDYSSSTYTVNKSRLEAFLGEDSFRNLEL
ncbi:Crp/Fnr family transcriptional regulator [Candidatus Saccharibacteria bacterium]|nr:Crp/Fnr family transcriptional regulator [Candidatus Saccharibacteria bacterium]